MIEKLVLQIEHDNDKAKNIQEEQDDMIDAYRCAYLCAGIDGKLECSENGPGGEHGPRC